ncbi:MAG: UDP-N-acetylglucosamine 2-epimerase (non-hydrolyzing) [Acidimicrobiia bacterium]
MKIVSVIGTRPQYVKAAVVTRALRNDGRFDEVTIDTGQHYDAEMSAFLLDDLPDVQRARNLDIHGGAEHEVLGRMIGSVGDALTEENPDAVLVYGDTNSTLAGALAASTLDVPLGHVEAGLRSYNRSMREERNRVLVDHLSQLLLCPTPTAMENLAREGVEQGLHHVGDVMYDAAIAAHEQVANGGDAPGAHAVATVHRAENTDDSAMLDKVLGYLRGVAAEHPVVLPLHPRTRKAIDAGRLSTEGLDVREPVSYLEMARLLTTATVVYTDSGGLQKEAYFARVPCVTLRNETEWVETVAAGWNRLWTVAEYEPRREISDYGDGHAGQAIVDALADTLGTR